MKLEDIKSKTKDAVDYLVQSLESGHSEVLTEYLGTMARFHAYSFGNVMLIARAVYRRIFVVWRMPEPHSL